MEIYRDAPDEIFAFENILRNILNFKNFKTWIKENGKNFEEDNLFEGYKFFIETSLRCLINEIVVDSSLGLNGDDIFRRADFTGKDIFELPNSSEKTKIIKYLALLLEDITISKNSEDLLKKCDSLLLFLNKIKKIYENSKLKEGIKINKDKMLKYLSLYWTHIFLMDNQKGVPHGYSLPLLKNKLSPEKMKKSLKGFQYSLKYIIELNYGSLEGKRLNDLIKSEQLKEEDIGERSSGLNDLISLIGDENEESELNDLINPEQLKEENKELTKKVLNDLIQDLSEDEERGIREDKDISNWRSIDRFFSIMQKEIMDPLEKEIEENFTMNRFFVAKDMDKSDLIEGIKDLPNPKYLELNDKESVFKKLDLKFLFYEIQTLDTKRQLVFNGVPAFIYASKGFAISREEEDLDEPVKIIRFVHPEKGVNGNNYSYAVLIEAYGSIADHSGWLVFYDCCGDYSGFSGSQHAHAESFIKSYLKKGLIEIQEFKVDLNYFKEYLAKKDVTRSFDEEESILKNLEESSKRRRLESETGHYKGLSLELFVYYLHSKKEPFEKIDWDVRYDPDIEFDVVFKRGDKITFCECKWSKNNKNNFSENVLKILKDSKFKEDWGEFEEKNVEKIYFSSKENERLRENSKKKGYKYLSVEKNFKEVYPEFREQINRFKFLSEVLDEKI